MKILFENREEEFRKKYLSKFGPDLLDRLSKISTKYLDWVGKTADPMSIGKNLPNLFKALSRFDEIHSNLPKPDINQYGSIDELINAISTYENRERRQYKQVEGANVVYEDENYLLVNPLTNKSSCYYGKGTKWCTTSLGNTQFDNYNTDGKLFYLLSKKLPTDNKFYKIAILKKFDGETKYWDALDDSITSTWILDDAGFMKKINNEIQNYMNSEFKEQIEIFSDKERAKKEKERLDKLRLERIRRQKEEDADERRMNREWELTPDAEDVAIKAHALLEYLVENENIEVTDNSDRDNIDRINREIEELNKRYEESEDVDTSILDRIEELESELEEIKNKMDVYNLVPIGSFYDMTEFEVLGMDGNTYAVGDEDEMQSSAEDYVSQLIDDIGYEGFQKGFAENYIDEDMVKRDAEEDYEWAVRDSPESYIGEEERMLSDNQEEEILVKNRIIEKLKEEISEMEMMIDNTDDEEYIEEATERIEEYNDKISEIEEEIEDINNSPEGDFSDEAIDNAVNNLVDDVVRDPVYYLKERGFDIENYINKDDFIQGVIDSDGYGIVSSYDGTVDEYRVMNRLYYVLRVN